MTITGSVCPARQYQNPAREDTGGCYAENNREKFSDAHLLSICVPS